MNSTPVLSPLLALLRSRKVIFSAVVFIVGILVSQFPVIAPFRDTLISLLAVILLIVVGGISVEDAAKYLGQRGNPLPSSNNPVLTNEEQLRQLMNDVIDARVSPEVTVPAGFTVTPPADNTVVMVQKI